MAASSARAGPPMCAWQPTAPLPGEDMLVAPCGRERERGREIREKRERDQRNEGERSEKRGREIREERERDERKGASRPQRLGSSERLPRSLLVRVSPAPHVRPPQRGGGGAIHLNGAAL